MRVQVKTVTVRGSVVKQVKCGKCQCDYAYEMFRQNTRRSDSSMAAAGMAGGLIGVAIAAAVSAASGSNSEEKLRDEARRNVDRTLAKGCEPVPCPACGWYQPEMVTESRRRYCKGLFGTGVTLLVLGAGGGVVLQSIRSSPNTSGSVGPMAVAIVTGIGLLGIAALSYRWHLRQAYDINQGYPARRPPYPGSPQGYDVRTLPKATTASDGKGASLDPLSPAQAPSNWYYARDGQQVGPVTWGDLKDLAAQNMLGPQDFVYAAGAADWVEASTVPGLF